MVGLFLQIFLMLFCMKLSSEQCDIILQLGLGKKKAYNSSDKRLGPDCGSIL